MERMEVGTTQAILSAISDAVSDGASCNVGTRACVTTDECAQRNAVCRGTGVDGVIPCCLDDQVCVRRTESESRCRTRGAPLPSFYLGGEDSFDACP